MAEFRIFPVSLIKLDEIFFFDKMTSRNRRDVELKTFANALCATCSADSVKLCPPPVSLLVAALFISTVVAFKKELTAFEDAVNRLAVSFRTEDVVFVFIWITSTIK